MSNLSQRIANLPPEKLDLLARRLAGRSECRPPELIIPRRQQSGERAPLSFAQRRMWILYQFDPTSAAFNIPAAVRLRGPLNVAALERSLSEIVRRHESLRTSFDEVDGQPTQIVLKPCDWSLAVIDLSELPAAAREAETRALVVAAAAQPFDLRQGPLLRTTLIRLAAAEHVLMLTLHHIVSDGWSMGLLVREVGQLYGVYSRGKESPLPELPLQYADYAEWQQDWLASDAARQQLAYWRQQLAEAPPVLELQTDRERPAVLSHRGAEQWVKLEIELTRAVKELARQAGVTLFALTLAAFNVLLFRRTGREDIVVGSNIANRNRSGIQNLIGFFVNNLVLRTRLAGNPTFRECLARVREVTLAAYANQDVPFELLLEELRPERVGNYTPLFQVMFLFQKNGPLQLEINNVQLSMINVETCTAGFDLTMVVEEGKHDLFVHLSYNTDLFLPSTISRMLEHYQNLLRSIVANPDERIAALSMTTSEEDAQLLNSFNAMLEEAL